MRDFKAELKEASAQLGYDLTQIEQGSEEWHIARSGVITASKAENLLAKPGTAKRDGYMAELVGQICTGLVPDEITAKALNWGKEHEEAARMAYSAATFETVEDLTFIYKDKSMRAGCSPDGMCDGYGLELKSPWASRTFIEFACAGKIKPEYMKQCQFSMWVSDLDRWDFANFDPRMANSKKLHFVTIDRDEKMIGDIESAYTSFCADMDEMLDLLGVRFGAHWMHEPKQAA